MSEAGRKQVALAQIANRLSALSGAWAVDGDRVRGPDRSAVIVGEHAASHSSSIGHLDIGFVLSVDGPDAPVVWDCAAGVGGSDELAIEQAIHIWSTTTAPAILEFLVGGNEFADHYCGHEPQGFAGRHAIHGAILGWGIGAGPNELQAWWMQHPLLPELRTALESELDQDVNGVKILFGSDGRESIAEVRVGDRRAERASAALLELDWPRFAEPAFVRSFVLVIPEAG